MGPSPLASAPFTAFLSALSLSSVFVCMCRMHRWPTEGVANHSGCQEKKMKLSLPFSGVMGHSQSSGFPGRRGLHVYGGGQHDTETAE